MWIRILGYIKIFLSLSLSRTFEYLCSLNRYFIKKTSKNYKKLIKGKRKILQLKNIE